MRTKLLSLTLALGSLALAACAPTSSSVGAAADPSPSHYQAAVAVDNGSQVPVTIKYYTKGGALFTLDEVGPGRSTTIVLPREDVGHIFAETAGGQRLHNQNLVQIRRVKLPA